MIILENVVLSSPEQLAAVIRGMRNPLNSWDRSDSGINKKGFAFGEQDSNLMVKLAANGRPHRKYLRMMPVYVDITAPLYWWKEFDTYKVGTVANSCSTMHKIQAKEFTLDDFSTDHLVVDSEDLLKSVIKSLNAYRQSYLDNNDKLWWWQMIQLLPSSYNQRRTVFMNYEVLANIYPNRKNHKLDEWRKFCDWIKELPCAGLILACELS